ncbi:Membrane metallo-endopeptidase-like 1 [Hypsibius exemplaris]|uniref:Membrane metallo-endopeptidase-like 1 n=1 Tax=Hypsibius exemplaris TaxID=2072580 RepID=A0A1W0X5H8_HYPEX|nr:Membrane metallo-endopeptidase-like 1 [Hypsibius exemplaris]
MDLHEGPIAPVTHNNPLLTVSNNLNASSGPVDPANMIGRHTKHDSLKSASWWKRKWTGLERILCGLLLAALFLLSGLIVALILSYETGKGMTTVDDCSKGVQVEGSALPVCLTQSCTKAANDLLEAMDQTADPCVDFYEFACGGWLKKNVVPEDKSRYSIFSQAKENLELTLKQVLESSVGAQEDSSTAKAKLMYKACMNETLIEEKGSRPALDLLQTYTPWPVLQTKAEATRFLATFDWVKTVAILRADGASYLIHMAVWADSRNTTNQIIHLDQPGVGMPSAEYLLRGFSDKYVQAYYNFMVDTAILLGADPIIAKADFKDVLEFEIEFAKIRTPREERRDAIKFYNKMTVRELQNHTDPGINWLDFFRTIMPSDVSITWEEPVIVSETAFFNKLIRLVNKTSKRVIANYLGWRVVQSVVWDLDVRFREVFNRYRNVLYGTSMEKSRWRSCVGIVTNYFDMAVGKLYVDNSFQAGSREQAEVMIDDISEAFLEILSNETDWMDAEAKSVAKDKADAISRKIGYPDMIKNKTALDKHFNGTVAYEDDHFKNVLVNSQVWAHKFLRELRDPFDKSKWATTPAEVNAFYSTDYNSVTFPAGILQPPFFEKDRPQSMNYGAIGMVIGHEITHGFDDQGRQKDKEGNLRDWWSPVTVSRFKNQTQCIIKQYEEFYVPEVNMTLNGVNTQGENIADNGGLKQAYRAYQKWRHRNAPKDIRLPGMMHITHEQIFFLSYAHIWCGISRPDAYTNDILSGVHSPDRFRVMGPLRNLPEFSQAFSCPSNSPMNPPPEKKCKVW